MLRYITLKSMLGLLAACLLFSAQQTAYAQGTPRISLSPSFFKVDWHQPPSETEPAPVAQEHVAPSGLEYKQYGAAANQLLTSGSSDNIGRPYSVWSGEAEGPFAVTFRDANNYVDLTGLGKMRWVVKTSGFHVVRPVIKLANGTMLVGDVASSALPMMTETEFAFTGVRWIELDPERVVTINNTPAPNGEIWVENPDLSRVDEVGFADLMPGSGHGFGGYIHLGTIEVFGEAVPR